MAVTSAEPRANGSRLVATLRDPALN